MSVMNNEFANRLKKDSLMSKDFDAANTYGYHKNNRVHAATQSKFSFKGNQTGNYRVILGGFCVL